VPLPLVKKLGKKVILFSLGTTNLKQAKKRRALAELKWDAQFDALEQAPLHKPTANGGHLPSQGGLMGLIQDYVQRTDERAKGQSLSDPPANMDQKAEIKADVEIELGVLKNLNDPRGAQVVHAVGEEIIKRAGHPLEAVPQDFFTEAVRRALLELGTRRHARINDDFSHTFFN